MSWKLWFNKFRAQLISFKFLAFWGMVILIVFAWSRLEHLYKVTMQQTQDMFAKGMLSQDNVAAIINQCLTTLFDSTLSHLLVFSGTVLSAIIAIKGVAYWKSKGVDAEVEPGAGEIDSSKKDLKKFLPKGK